MPYDRKSIAGLHDTAADGRPLQDVYDEVMAGGKSGVIKDDSARHSMVRRKTQLMERIAEMVRDDSNVYHPTVCCMQEGDKNYPPLFCVPIITGPWNTFVWKPFVGDIPNPVYGLEEAFIATLDPEDLLPELGGNTDVDGKMARLVIDIYAQTILKTMEQNHVVRKDDGSIAPPEFHLVAMSWGGPLSLAVMNRCMQILGENKKDNKKHYPGVIIHLEAIPMPPYKLLSSIDTHAHVSLFMASTFRASTADADIIAHDNKVDLSSPKLNDYLARYEITNKKYGKRSTADEVLGMLYPERGDGAIFGMDLYTCAMCVEFNLRLYQSMALLKQSKNTSEMDKALFKPYDGGVIHGLAKDRMFMTESFLCDETERSHAYAVENYGKPPEDAGDYFQNASFNQPNGHGFCPSFFFKGNSSKEFRDKLNAYLAGRKLRGH